MKMTKFNVSHSTLRSVVGNAMRNKGLFWRHHGVGMYQAYLHEGDNDEEVRVHVWHPSLVLPTLNVTNGIMHDHRFGFDSYVLQGGIYNEVWLGAPDPSGEWVHYACVNAREAHSRGGTFHEPLGRADNELWTYSRSGSWHLAGQQYMFPPRMFHYSRVEELTVTLVVKTTVVDGYARILAKKDTELVHAFDHSRDIDMSIIAEAAMLLER